MKRKYITPQITIVEVEPMSVMALSNFSIVTPPEEVVPEEDERVDATAKETDWECWSGTEDYTAKWDNNYNW